MKFTQSTILILFFLAVSCGVSGQSSVEEISADQLISLQEKGAMVIDVRRRDEFISGKIPDATNIVLNRDFVKNTEIMANNQDVILYCRSGRRSAMAADLLLEAGYEGKIYNYRGSMLDWKARGMKVE